MPNIFKLATDHPGFPARVTLALETWLSFAWAGAGHGVYTIAFASCHMAREPVLAGRVNNCMALIVTAAGAWKSASSAVAHDFELHYRYPASNSQLFYLEIIRLAGFFLSRALLSHHASKFSAPLFYLLSDPPNIVKFFYNWIVLWAVWNLMPEIVVISSRGFTLPKFIARYVGIIVEVSHQVRRANVADAILRQGSANDAQPFVVYEYHSIRHPRTIRLLRLDTSQKEIDCRLETVRLDEAPEFWAVSYLWGSEEKPTSLRITHDDGSFAGHIPVTRNCAAAIEALAPNGVRYLWVDAVCINQSDILEKQSQIPLMGDIYSQASLVAGHLYTDNLYPVGLLVHKILQGVGNGKKFDMSYAASAPIFRALSALFQHQYFERVWITQEIVLARSIFLIYGKDVVYLDHLMEISRGQSLDLIEPPRSVVAPVASGPNASRVQNEWYRFTMSIASFRGQASVIGTLRTSLSHGDNSHRMTVAQIIDSNLSRGAKNPRDQVYALLSLASDSAVPELQPNYSQLVSDKEIFTKISWHYLQDGKHLNLFLSAGLSLGMTILEMPTTHDSPKRTPGLPSWVYDFATGVASENRGNWAVTLERTRSSRLDCHISADMEQLLIRGSIIDEVACVGPAFHLKGQQDIDMVSLPTELAELPTTTVAESRRLAQQYAPETYPNGVSRDEVYWRTMLMDQFAGQTPAPPHAKDVLDMFLEYEPQLVMGRAPSAGLPSVMKGMSPHQRAEAIRSIIDIATKVWMAYTFVVTKHGHMGWAPRGTNPGDVFCLFDGCVVPFVLRPQEEGDAFALLADGYIHGFLPGQQFRPEETSKKEIRLV